MMQEGLLKEAENLFPYRHLNALQTVGYKELFDFMEGKISLSKAIEDIKKIPGILQNDKLHGLRKKLLTPEGNKQPCLIKIIHAF